MATADKKQDIVTAEPVSIPHSDGKPAGAPLIDSPEKVISISQVNVDAQSASKNGIEEKTNIKSEKVEPTPDTKVVETKKEDSNLSDLKLKDGANQNDIKSADTNSKKGSREEKHARRKDERSIDQILRALSGLESPQDKLAALCKKYADSCEENRKLQIQVKNIERRLAQVERERDAAQGEHSKAVLTRSRLEGLCRELQRQNRAIKDESLLKIREEEEKRKEVSNKFQTTLAEINTLMQQNNEKNIKLRDDNIEMTTKFKSVCEQYELRVQQVEKISKQMQLEAQLADAKLAKARMEGAAEKEILLQEKRDLLMELAQYQQKCQDLQQTEINLRTQIEMYTSKYDEFQNALCRSNQVFGGFKGEMDKMSKKIVKLEKETSTWKQRWEKSHQALLEMATDKQQRDAELSLANRQLTQLHKLCRTLTEERAKLMAQIQTNDPEKQEKLSADIAQDRRKLNETLDDVHAVLLERERLHELQQLEKKHLDLQNQLHLKQLEQQEQQKQTEDNATSVAPSQPSTTKNDKKKGKKGKNGRQNQESPVINGNAKKPSASPEKCPKEENTSNVSVASTNVSTLKSSSESESSSEARGESLTEAEKAPVKTETAPVTTETAPIKAEATHTKAEIAAKTTIPAKASTTPTKTEAISAKAEITTAKTEIPPTKADAALAEAEAAPAKAEAAPAKAQAAPAKAEAVPAKAQAAPAKAEAAPAKAEDAPAKAQAAPAKAQAAPAKAEAATAKAEAAPAKAEAAQAKAQAAPAKAQAAPAKAEAAPAKTEAAPAKAEAAPAKAQAAPAKAEAAPVKAQTAPAKAEAAPAKAEAAPTKAVAPPTKAETVPAKVEAAPAKAEAAPAEVGAAPVKAEAAPAKAETAPAKAEAAPAMAETPAAKAEAPAAKADAVKVEPKPPKVDSATAKVETTPTKVEPTPANLKPAPCKVVPASPVNSEHTSVMGALSTPNTESPTTNDEAQLAKAVTTNVKTEVAPSAPLSTFSYAAALGSKPSENLVSDSVSNSTIEKTSEKLKERSEEKQTPKQLDITDVQKEESSDPASPISPFPVSDVESKPAKDLSLDNIPPALANENPSTVSQEPSVPANNNTTSPTSQQSRKGKEPAKRKKK